MNTKVLPSTAALAERLSRKRLVCVAIIDHAEDAVPLAEALLAGGLDAIEVTLRTPGAMESIARIRKNLPEMCVGAGTVLTPEQAKQAVDLGAQFSMAPGLDEHVVTATHDLGLPFFPGVWTPSEISHALRLGCTHLKFFPAAASGAALLKTIAGPFLHTGVRFLPTGGITTALMPDFLAIPQVFAVGGAWMAERKLIADKAWSTITAHAAEAVKIAAR